MRNNIFLFVLVFGLIFPCVIVFAQDSTWFDNISTQLTSLLIPIIELLATIALLMFIWGMVIFIMKSGDKQANSEGKQKILSNSEGKQKMIWGVIGLFVIFSIWGIVGLLQTMTGAGSASAPTIPQIINPFN